MMEEIVEVEDVVKIVKIGKNSYTCFDLEYGYLVDVDSGATPNTKDGAIANSTGMSEDEIRKLRISTVNKLYEVISRLTYPDLYDEDGNLKSDLPEIDEDGDSKKKV